MPQRIAIVTGAARGIGAGTAKRLASDGMAVAVLDLNEGDCKQTVAEIEKAGGRAIAVRCGIAFSSFPRLQRHRSATLSTSMDRLPRAGRWRGTVRCQVLMSGPG